MNIGLGIGTRYPKVNQLSLALRAISAIRRNNGTALYVPDDYGLVLGPELAGLDTAWAQLGTGVTQSEGQIAFAASPSNAFAKRGDVLQVGKRYRLEFTIASISSGAIDLLLGGGAGIYGKTTAGTYVGCHVATGADGPYLLAASGPVTAVVTKVSVREIITATTYIDSTGTQPVTAVGDLVGLLTDRSYGAGNLGANTAPTLTTGNWTTVNTTISGGVATVAGVGTYSTFLSAIAGVQPGKSYQVTYTISDYVSGSCYANLGGYNDGAPMRSGNGVFTEIQAVTNPSSNPSVSMRHTLVGKVSNIFVREVLGNHASQPTTASKPVVTRVPKRLGPNLVVNGDFSGGKTPWDDYLATSTITSGELIHTSNGGHTYQSLVTVVGKTYVATAVVRKISGSDAYIAAQDGAGDSVVRSESRKVASTTAVPVTLQFVAGNATTNIQCRSAVSGGVGGFDNITVQEVLEWTPALKFDGSNDSLSLPINTGTSGTLIAGVRPKTLGWKMIFGSGAQLGNMAGVRLGMTGSTNCWLLGTSNGTYGADSQSLSPAVAGISEVVSATWNPTQQVLRVGGVVQDSRSSYIAATTNGLSVGAAQYGGGVGDFFDGDIAWLVYLPSEIPEADRKTIERNMAQRIGATYAG